MPEEESAVPIGLPENPDITNTTVTVFCCTHYRYYAVLCATRGSCNPGEASDGWARG